MWQLLRRQWVEGKDVSEEVGAFSPTLPLPKAYENLVIESDRIADRFSWRGGTGSKTYIFKRIFKETQNAATSLSKGWKT